MVRVRNVSRREIVEGGRVINPGAIFETTPDRVEAYKQRVQRVRDQK
jgi:hypothetical protein